MLRVQTTIGLDLIHPFSPLERSGTNTMYLYRLITLRLNFNPTASYFGVNGNPDACFLKVFALYDTFLTITPGTGIMRTET